MMGPASSSLTPSGILAYISLSSLREQLICLPGCIVRIGQAVFPIVRQLLEVSRQKRRMEILECSWSSEA